MHIRYCKRDCHAECNEWRTKCSKVYLHEMHTLLLPYSLLLTHSSRTKEHKYTHTGPSPPLLSLCSGSRCHATVQVLSQQRCLRFFQILSQRAHKGVPYGTDQCLPPHSPVCREYWRIKFSHLLSHLLLFSLTYSLHLSPPPKSST